MAQTYTENFTEIHELAGAVVDTFAAGIHEVMAYRSMANHQRAVCIIVTGAFDQAASLAVVLAQATTADGTDAKQIGAGTGKGLALAANSVYAIEVRTEELDVSGGFAYLGGTLIATGNVEVAIVWLLGGANYPPVPTTNWTEIVT